MPDQSRTIIEAGDNAKTWQGPAVSVSDARRLGQERGLSGVVLIGVKPDGTVSYASWGSTKARCTTLGRWLDWLVDQGRKLPEVLRG